MENQQLIKKDRSANSYSKIFPWTFTDLVLDRVTNESLDNILVRNNFIALPYVGSKAATRLQVPMKNRRRGIWLSYIDYAGTLTVEYYNDNNLDDNHWQDSSYWLPYNTAEFQPASVGLSALAQEVFDWIYSQITTAVKLNPEDLQKNSSGQIEEANRAYDTSTFSGLGYRILRKNIQSNKNILTQSMINMPNTIYEIRYDFDLNGATINIPANSVLQFEGGSISNGSIDFTDTFINSYKKSFNLITCKGSIINSYVDPIIFGADDTGKLDSSDVVNNLLQVTNSIKFGKGVYILSNIIVKSKQSIVGIEGGTIIKPLSNSTVIFDTDVNAEKILFKDFSILGVDTTTMCIGIRFNSSKYYNCDSNIINIRIENLRGTGIHIHYGCSNMVVDNCNIRNIINKVATDEYNSKYGYGIIAHCSDSLFSNLNIGGAFNAGLRLNGGNQAINCKCWGNGRYGVAERGCGIYLNNGYNIISNCSVEENSDCGIYIGGSNNKVNIACAGNGADQGKPWTESHISYDIVMAQSLDAPYRCVGNEVNALIREPALGDSTDYYLKYTDTSGIAIHDNTINITTYTTTSYDNSRLSDTVRYYFHDTISFNGVILKEIYTKQINRFFPFVDVADIDCYKASEDNMGFTIKPNSNLTRTLFHINWLIPKTDNISTICKVGYFYAEIKNPEVLADTNEVALIIQFSRDLVAKGTMQQNPINGKYFIRALYYNPSLVHNSNPYFYFRIKFNNVITSDVNIELTNMRIGLITDGYYDLNSLLANERYSSNMWYYYYYTQSGFKYSIPKGATILRKLESGDERYIWNGEAWTNTDGTLTTKVTII